jgi:hypothetical protein
MYDESKYGKLYTLFATFKPCTNPNLFYEAHCFQGKFAKEVTVEDNTDNPLVAFMTQGLQNDSDTESSTSKPNDRGLSRMRPTSVDTSEDYRKPAARKSCDLPDEENRKPAAKGCSIQKSHSAHREPFTKDQSHSSSDDDEPYDYKPFISKKSHAAQPPVPMFSTPSYLYAPYGGYCAPAPPQMSHPPHQPYFAYPPMPQQVMNGHNPQFFGPPSSYVGGYSVATGGPTYYSGPPSAVYPRTYMAAVSPHPLLRRETITRMLRIQHRRVVPNAGVHESVRKHEVKTRVGVIRPKSYFGVIYIHTIFVSVPFA